MGLATVAGLRRVPETPRFLAKSGRLPEARAVLLSLRGDPAVAAAELQVRGGQSAQDWTCVFA